MSGASPPSRAAGAGFLYVVSDVALMKLFVSHYTMLVVEENVGSVM